MIVEDVERVYFDIFPVVINRNSLDSLPRLPCCVLTTTSFSYRSSRLATVNFLACKSALVSSNSSMQSV